MTDGSTARSVGPYEDGQQKKKKMFVFSNKQKEEQKKARDMDVVIIKMKN